MLYLRYLCLFTYSGVQHILCCFCFVFHRLEVLGVLTTALEISQASVSREAYLEAEILFNLGNIFFYSLDTYNIMNGISSFYCSDS